MKTFKKKFGRSTVLVLLSINWAVMILATSYFIKDTENFTPILWTLAIGFSLQLGFLPDQLKGLNHSNN
ncbi:MAG: hypothetical protein ACI857_000592 [Arenicella sp.]|jgi:hypothetical protein